MVSIVLANVKINKEDTMPHSNKKNNAYFNLFFFTVKPRKFPKN